MHGALLDYVWMKSTKSDQWTWVPPVCTCIIVSRYMFFFFNNRLAGFVQFPWAQKFAGSGLGAYVICRHLIQQKGYKVIFPSKAMSIVTMNMIVLRTAVTSAQCLAPETNRLVDPSSPAGIKAKYLFLVHPVPTQFTKCPSVSSICELLTSTWWVQRLIVWTMRWPQPSE